VAPEDEGSTPSADAPADAPTDAPAPAPDAPAPEAPAPDAPAPDAPAPEAIVAPAVTPVAATSPRVIDPAVTAADAVTDEAEERLAHEPEAAMAAHVLDPGHRPPVEYPDDSWLVRVLRRIDRAFGIAEQVALFGLLAVMVIIACIEAVAERMHSGFLWSFDIVRDATFAIAMLGAAFATYQQRNLSMDLVSRRLGHKARMILRVFLASITIAAASLFLYAGWILRGKVIDEPNLKTYSFDLSGVIVGVRLEELTVSMIPLGASLIIFHSFLQIVIEVDYLVRGKLSPERERVGH
jgi:TRAP-type C4-dicarboxylate transport system permease small subunit